MFHPYLEPLKNINKTSTFFMLFEAIINKDETSTNPSFVGTPCTFRDNYLVSRLAVPVALGRAWSSSVSQGGRGRA